jgi:hypothetical protein
MPPKPMSIIAQVAGSGTPKPPPPVIVLPRDSRLENGPKPGLAAPTAGSESKKLFVKPSAPKNAVS